MKPKLLTLLLLGYLPVLAQQKPKRFTAPAVVCPIHYSNLSVQGITNASQLTMDIQESPSMPIVAGRSLPANAVVTAAGNAYITTDTTFKYALVTQRGQAFEVIQQVGSFTLIKLWAYSKKTDASKRTEYEAYVARKVKNKSIPGQINGIRVISPAEFAAIDTAAGNGITASSAIDPSKDYYLIKTADLNGKAEDFDYKVDAWNVGAMILPVKIRPFATTSGAFDFSSNVNLGISFSWVMHHNIRNDWTANLLIYLGGSSIKLDSLTAGDPNFKPTGQLSAAFSPAAGVYWEKKGIQLGIATGMDFLIGGLQKSWVYRGMPWLSLTAGINIFNLSNNSTKGEGTN